MGASVRQDISKKYNQTIQWVIDRPTTIFLIFSLFFGLIFVFKIAPLVGTDEFTHFPRIVQIQQGRLWEDRLPSDEFGGSIPNNVSTMVDEYRNLSRIPSGSEYVEEQKTLRAKYLSTKIDANSQTVAIFTSVVTYPPWAYLPGLIGVSIAKIFDLPLLAYVYLGRIVSLLLWIALTWLAIRLLPSGKWFLVAVALLPTSLTQAATVGSDGFLNGLSWVVIAFVFAVFARKITVDWRSWLFISFLSLYLCVIKQGYWLIALFPLAIPGNLFPSIKKSYIWKAATFTVLSAASIWVAIRTSKVTEGVLLTPREGVYINIQAQQDFVLHNPLLFIGRALSDPFTKNYDTIFQGMVGIITNRLIYLSFLVMALLFFLLFVSFSFTRVVPKIAQYKKRLWVASLVIIIGTYLFISLAFYLANTEVGSPTIFGVYGRYFLPLFPLVLIIPMTLKSRFTIEPTTFGTFVLGILLLSLYSTVKAI